MSATQGNVSPIPVALIRVDVLYVTCVDLGPENNGGALCCRNHVRKLAADPSIRLQVAVIGTSGMEHGNRAFAEEVGADFHFIAFQEIVLDPDDSRLNVGLSNLFPWERTSLVQSHVSDTLRAVVARVEPEAIVIDYLPTALFALPIFESPLPVVVITLQDERKFFRDLRERVQSPEWSGNDLAEERLSQFERWVYSRAAAVIALRQGDLEQVTAAGTPPARQHVVSPVFPLPEERWRYRNSRSIFFVGNHHHFPNRSAIDWLCTQLAPLLWALDPSIQLRIIGAHSNELPSYAANDNICFLGYADRETVNREFVDCALFIAPISLDYGCEIKLQECAAHATPFVATASALEGLPSLPMVPIIKLEDAAAAAGLIYQLIGDARQLADLSEQIAVRMEDERERQRPLFGDIVRDSLGPLSHTH